MISPLFDERALVIESSAETVLVLADLHIGIEIELSLRGINIPSQTSELLQRCLSICEAQHPDRIVLLGDVKHVIPSPVGKTDDYRIALQQERMEVRHFLGELKHYSTVDIILGNHDGNLRSIVSPHPVRSVRGFSITTLEGDIGFVHGHAWPSSEVMQCDFVLIGHSHPTIMFRDKLGYTLSQPCWLRGHFLSDKIKEKFGAVHPHVIVMPAFNTLCGGIAVNAHGIAGPLGKLMDLDAVTVHLLNGINLGTVENLRY